MSSGSRSIIPIGDVLAVKVSPENRSWGYHPFPDGERVKVVGYSTVHYGRVWNHGNEPGLYHNPSWLKVRGEDGKEEVINICHLETLPGAEKKLVGVAELRIGGLPDTPIWEWDMVRGPEGEVMKVVSIDYEKIGHFAKDGVTPLSFYVCEWSQGGTTRYRPGEVKLVERGNVWKRAHGEELVFSDMSEEEDFYRALNEYDHVRNPATGTYAWTKEEALLAISEGLAHGFGDRKGTDVVIYRDAEVGERIRQATMETYGLSLEQAMRPR